MQRKLYFSALICALVLFPGCSDKLQKQPVKEKYIQLQPFRGTRPETVAQIARCLEEEWGMPCRISPLAERPRAAYIAQRRRYSADSLLRFLRQRKETDARWILGILADDMETPKGSSGWGIMGLAHLGGEAAVISGFRPARGGVGKHLFQRRMNILAQHELGHCAGLDHCADRACILQDARGKMRLDSSTGFCRSCADYWRRNGPVSRTYSQHAENKEKNTPLKFL